MRTPTRLILTLASTVAFTLAACGGDGGGGPVDSGLPPEKTGMELTADEADKLCLANNENLAGQVSAAELKNSLCVSLGIGFAGAAGGKVEECESFAKMCRDGAGEEGDEQGGDMCSLGFELSTCTATVGDIEACMTEKNEAFAEGVRTISCADVDKEPTDPVTGPSCTKIKTTCPGIA